MTTSISIRDGLNDRFFEILVEIKGGSMNG